MIAVFIYAAETIRELNDFEKDHPLTISHNDRWTFRFEKDFMIVVGKDHQRVALSARNPGQVIMHYSFVK